VADTKKGFAHFPSNHQTLKAIIKCAWKPKTKSNKVFFAGHTHHCTLRVLRDGLVAFIDYQ